MSKNLDLDIEACRIVAVCAVVFMHVGGCVIEAHGTIPDWEWWLVNIAMNFSLGCVPLFVMVSGTLLLNTEKHESYGSFVRRRSLRILWPYLACIVIYGSYRYYCLNEPMRRLIADAVRGSIRDHTYFLFLIAALSLFAPAVKGITEDVRDLLTFSAVVLTLIFLGFYLQCFHRLHMGYLNFSTPFVAFLPYFMLAGWLKSTVSKRSKLLLAGVIFSAIAVISVCVKYAFSVGAGKPTATYWKCFYNFPVFFYACALYALMFSMRIGLLAERIFGRALLLEMSRSALGIYVVHHLLIRLLWRVYPWNPASTVPAAHVIWALAYSAMIFVCSLAIVVPLRRIPVIRRAFS